MSALPGPIRTLDVVSALVAQDIDRIDALGEFHRPHGNKNSTRTRRSGIDRRRSDRDRLDKLLVGLCIRGLVFHVAKRTHQRPGVSSRARSGKNRGRTE